ncbi:MAG TPA: carbamoyl-phosphate synthase large subunit, partial [Phycisphaerales bacterium]|nr:carbamoyl-phosphate synthase large subunit [Phycisphaerales bacterium]
MPRRDDIHTILIIGSGPIVIGQGCEFDYSGVQACKSLKAEGYRVVLVNSNPATIMTDPSLADRTYIEPVTPDAVRKIIAREAETGTPVDAVLPTLGGQTGLNCACALHDSGVLEEFGVEMIGADRGAISRAEDREQFAAVCAEAGLATPESKTVTTLDEGRAFLEQIGLPAIIRPAFTLGGWGGGIAYNTDEFDELVTRGLRASMIGQVQIDRSLLGWKEYELEVVRDKKDNCVIVCGIENIDPMGVHTGDSITVAPILTLTDKEYQTLRDAAITIMRGVGVETGGSNVQFAVNPNPEPDSDGRRRFDFVVVEMNPRVSRSSALASKATGFPIAKIAAKLAVGYTLDELRNDITGTTSACFEPSIDYVVTKMPRWTFEKFPEADETLTTQMKSVGEAMAIGRTFKESLQKAVRSMDVKRFGLGLDRNDKWLAAMRAAEREGVALETVLPSPEIDTDNTTSDPVAGGRVRLGLRTADGQPIEWPIAEDKLRRKLGVPSQGRLYYIRYAFKMGWTVERVFEQTKIDPFFLDQILQLVEFEDVLCGYDSLEDVPREVLFEAKRLGYSDAQLANLYLGTINSETILKVRRHRESLGVRPVFKCVDTCAAEFEAITPYYYSTYQPGWKEVDSPESCATAVARSREIPPEDEIGGDPAKEKIIILGGGPNRIGQGIEFDYCCVHAAFAARDLGFESVMINSNPETVSTDYDTSDLLFFEPLTLEDTLNVIERLNQRGPSGSGGSSPVDRHNPVRGVVVQFGGQTPLNLAHGLALAGVPLLGTSLDSIDLAEDRERFDTLLEKLDLKRPPGATVYSIEEAVTRAQALGYPVLVRPSYVLGGRGMEICADEHALRHFMTNALRISDQDNAPVLIDKFLDGAVEIDVDVVADFPASVGQASRLSSSRSSASQRKTGETPVPPGHSPPQAIIAGVMEHIEHAGVHSGDSTCAIPPFTLSPRTVEHIRDIARDLARELNICGLMNIQLAVKDDEIYIIEVNPRASRTVPFVGKAKHEAWAAAAARAMMGVPLAEQGVTEKPDTGVYAVKAPVFPFQKFPGVDFVLGPEMRSTGEVMGVDVALPNAYLKALLAAGTRLPSEGGVFISVRED